MSGSLFGFLLFIIVGKGDFNDSDDIWALGAGIRLGMDFLIHAGFKINI